ncbi:LOG family protein [Azospirillum sp. sgz302134]
MMARTTDVKGRAMKAPKSVCVYCGASSRVADVYKDAAHALGEGLARRDIQLVYGGGRVGLMGIMADAALGAGGRVVGIIPEHIQSAEVEHLGVTELHVVDSMHTRKRMMVDRSDAFVVLPGGFGTMDEAFEILTWKQLRLHDKPVVLVDVDGYWRPLLGLIDHMIAQGFAQDTHRALFTIVDEVDHVFDALANEPEPSLKIRSQKL